MLHDDRRSNPAHPGTQLPSGTSVLILECDPLFRAALGNHLLSAGIARVDSANSIPKALMHLRRGYYQMVLIGCCRPFRRALRLAASAARRQPQARILGLISAADHMEAPRSGFDYVIRERAFADLSEWM